MTVIMRSRVRFLIRRGNFLLKVSNVICGSVENEDPPYPYITIHIIEIT